MATFSNMILCCLATVALTINAASLVRLEDPFPIQGMYCGSYSGVIDRMAMTMINEHTFNISASVFSQKIGCFDEGYTFFPMNTSVVVPGLMNSTNCLGKYCSVFGLDPTQVDITYQAKGDEIVINAEGETLNFNKQNCKTK